MFELEHLFSLLTLTGLEIVLGIDNIVVIAIIASTLPAHQRDSARIVGLSLAMITRLALLFSIVWIESAASGITVSACAQSGCSKLVRTTLKLGAPA